MANPKKPSARKKGVDETLKYAGFSVRIDSDKCDWRIAAAKKLPPRRHLHPVADKCDGGELRLDPGVLRFGGVNRRFGGAVASDKCEWRLRGFDDIYTADVKVLGRQLQVSVGLKNGQRLRFSGASSDKCEFHLRDFTIYEGDWRVPETVAPSKVKKSRTRVRK